MSNNIEEKIVIIQNWYRQMVKFKLGIIRKFNEDIENLYYLIFSTMNRIQNNFLVGIFTQNKYNTHMIQLDSILDKFKTIPKPLTLKNILIVGEEELIMLISNIKLELINLCKNCGMTSIFDIVKLIGNINLHNNNKDINDGNMNPKKLKSVIYIIDPITGKTRVMDAKLCEKGSSHTGIFNGGNRLLRLLAKGRDRILKCANEYVDAFCALYEPNAYMDRVYSYYLKMGAPRWKAAAKLPTLTDIRALSIVVWRQGIKRSTRFRFWRYMVGMAIHNPALLEQFLVVLAHNEHFQEYRGVVTREIQEQLAELPAKRELQPA